MCDNQESSPEPISVSVSLMSSMSKEVALMHCLEQLTEHPGIGASLTEIQRAVAWLSSRYHLG